MSKGKILFSAGFILVILFAMIVDFYHTFACVRHARQQYQSLSDNIISDRLLLESEAKIKQKTLLLTKAAGQFQINDDTASIIFRLFSLAKLTDVNVDLLGPHELRHLNGQTLQIIELTLTAQLLQLNAYCNEIQRQHLPIVFTKIDLRHETDDVWRMKIHLTAFVKKASQGNFEINMARQSEASMRISYPINQIHYAGQINSNDIRWALIKLPSGRTLPAQIGSIVGIEHQAVTAIEEQKIILLNRQEIVK